MSLLTDEETNDTTPPDSHEPPFTAKELGRSSLACNVPFILYTLVNPDSCHPNVVIWFWITTGLLGLGLILAVCAARVGSGRWGYAAIAPPVVFVVGVAYQLLHISRIIC